MTKSLLASKTFWVNAVALAALATQWAMGHHWLSPEDSAFVLGVANIGLRIVTYQAVTVPGVKSDV